MTERHAVAMRPALVVGLSVLGFLLLASAPATASMVSLDVSELEIEGDNDRDAITISTDGTTLTIVDTGTGGATTTDPDCAQVNLQTVTCPATLPGSAPVDDFEVELRNGVDSFVNQNLVTIDGHVHSQEGGAATGAKTIVGGPGGQSLDGGQDSDSIDGGDGNDRLFDGGGGTNPTGGNDLLVGGNGDDETAYFRSLNTNLTIRLDQLANDGAPGEADNVQVENVIAGNGDDVMVGDGASNTLSGAGGSDQISGLGGNDELFGEFDSSGLVARGILGFAGDDTLDGGAGRDGLDCGRGFDLALREPLDEVEANCERIGAEVAGDSATVSGKKKNKFKVEIECPESEGATCAGKLKISAAGKKVGKGKFSVGAGKSKPSKAKLTKKGVKALKGAGGSLLVTVLAKTTEPGGVSEDSETILLHR